MLLERKTHDQTAGIYLHLPFCHSKCTYCGFVTSSYDEGLSVQYLQALEREIRNFPPPDVVLPERLTADTLYLGGGTPSILPPEALDRLIRLCREQFQTPFDAEVTIEINPGDTQPERLAAFRQSGINRASLGVQSFLDHQLRATGRDHTAEQARQSFMALRESGFDNLSLDFIVGLPKQTMEEWKYNLSEALKLNPEHLSLYLLEIKEGTKLASLIATEKLPAPDDDLAAEMYEYTLDTLESAGFEAYEISNFARSPAFRSRHNLKYWLEAPFYGFGVGAHSYDGQERYWNTSHIHAYIEQVMNHGSALASRTHRTEQEKFQEALMMGLRLRDGISLSWLESRYGINVQKTYAAELDRLLAANAIELDGDVLRLTRAGVLVSNEVFVSLM